MKAAALAWALGLVWPAAAAAESASPPHPAGRPTVILDRLVFPDSLHGSDSHRRHLKQVLKREARRADWGAGKDSRIEYRFTVKQLRLSHENGVLQVHCVAQGLLPRGKRAVSRLSYGGDPKQQKQLIRRVLEIVARGVITRLANLERKRREQP